MSWQVVTSSGGQALHVSVSVERSGYDLLCASRALCRTICIRSYFVFEASLARECVRVDRGSLLVLLDCSVVSCHCRIVQAQFCVMLDIPVDAFRWPPQFRVQFIEVLMKLSQIMPVLSFGTQWIVPFTWRISGVDGRWMVGAFARSGTVLCHVGRCRVLFT